MNHTLQVFPSTDNTRARLGVRGLAWILGGRLSSRGLYKVSVPGREYQALGGIGDFIVGT